MARFFLEKKQQQAQRIEIAGEDAHHISAVLRLQEGDSIECVGKEGQVHLVEITDMATGIVFGEIKKTFTTDEESPLYLSLFQGLAKGNKMDFVVQKAVELGVSEIVPFTSRYTVVRLKDNQVQTRLRRWRRIAAEAAKQCGRTSLPKVKRIHSFADVLDEVKKRGMKEEVVLLPYEGERQLGLKEITNSRPKAVTVIIGPEGGFHGEEVEQLSELEARIISLGPRILRTETAGLVALSLIGYKWGDLG